MKLNSLHRFKMMQGNSADFFADMLHHLEAVLEMPKREINIIACKQSPVKPDLNYFSVSFQKLIPFNNTKFHNSFIGHKWETEVAKRFLTLHRNPTSSLISQSIKPSEAVTPFEICRISTITKGKLLQTGEAQFNNMSAKMRIRSSAFSRDFLGHWSYDCHHWSCEICSEISDQVSLWMTSVGIHPLSIPV